MWTRGVVAVVLMLGSCQTAAPPPAPSPALSELQDQVSRQAQIIADQQQELQALRSQSRPKPKIFHDTMLQTLGSSVLATCWDVQSVTGSLGEPVDDAAYMRVIGSKLRPECGIKPNGNGLESAWLSEDKVVKACQPLSLLFDYLKQKNPNARPAALYGAIFYLSLVIRCNDAQTLPRLQGYISDPDAQVAKLHNPDCNDFDAVVDLIRRVDAENHITDGDSEGMKASLIVGAARQYQVDHGCRAPAPVAPAPLPTTTTDCEPSAFHDGSFSCTTH